jgi:hypothetical protein
VADENIIGHGEDHLDADQPGDQAEVDQQTGEVYDC